ncbi:cytochrome c maturation protein CcmE [Marinivivus vitaminiproducens]|uniref:cytochrome c maturation protein CcmE n=1 Tax=Marinivivus vitaminiproducens TaxID=3035935 RepID=UPI0027A071E4|nr:cytochrome c maturation protein CcmE [Geminicoccaceae bacterium SCSIO 64248]
MPSRRRQRLLLLATVVLLLGGSVAMALTALRDNVVFFISPSEVAAGTFDPDQRFRLGGLVAQGSVERGDGAQVRFILTDRAQSVPVVYTGLLPDLFREGQGIVAHGTVDAGGTFVADEVLAKHDEEYMPPEVAEALKRSGHWEAGDTVASGSRADEAQKADR